MKQERKDHGEMYYVTNEFTSAEDLQPLHGKKMDSVQYRCSVPPQGTTLPEQYENGDPNKQIVLHYVEEEVSYMADYIANENNEIQDVRFDPVGVSARNKILIIKQKGVAPDTP